MKSSAYTKKISFAAAVCCFAVALCGLRASACGPYYPDRPDEITLFRTCSYGSHEWEDTKKYQDNERDANCKLWQKITSQSIPLKDIDKIVYHTDLNDILMISAMSSPHSNAFAEWLADPKHSDDFEYITTAKKIEELRDFIATDPWYYPYDGDEEHQMLNELLKKCLDYKGSRHAARYALQTVRLYFAQKNYDGCIDLWEKKISKMPKDAVTDMIASYVGGAYYRKGDRAKAIELYTRAQDIASLAYMDAWKDIKSKSNFTDARIKKMELIFDRCPDASILNVKLESYVTQREALVYNLNYRKQLQRRGENDADYDYRDYPDAEDELFIKELKQFAKQAAASDKCNQKAMWYHALAYLYYLDGDHRSANMYLTKAEHSDSSELVKESIRVLRFMMDATTANNSQAYYSRLLRDLKWLDERMKEHGTNLGTNWQYYNMMNYSVCYWQDVARRVLLGEICPRLKKAGNTTLALQLANYASNRIHQISPEYKFSNETSFYEVCGLERWGIEEEDEDEDKFINEIKTIDDYRMSTRFSNEIDYCNQFFDWINGMSADEAAAYANSLANAGTELGKFLNEHSYTDRDYIYEIVGTLYLREMNYAKAEEWLSRVTSGYQMRTNLGKSVYYNLDPFRYQVDHYNYIDDWDDYKLRFAQEMARLERVMKSDGEPNRKALAKIRYALGLRNSFGKCWYLTYYGKTVNGKDYYDGDYNYLLFECYSYGDQDSLKNETLPERTALRIVERLTNEAMAEFTDPEQAAKAQLEMMNFKSVMSQYPNTKAAMYVRGHCDTYRDYAMQKR